MKERIILITISVLLAACVVFFTCRLIYAALKPLLSILG